MGFEDFLQNEFSKIFPLLLDDEIQDAFNSWLSELQADDFIKFGDEFGDYIAQ